MLRTFIWQVCKQCFAFTLTPCTDSVMIVTYDCLSVFINPSNVTLSVSTLVSAKAMVSTFMTMGVSFSFFPSNVLARRASASLLCQYHGCSIWSLCSFQLHFLQNSLTAAWLHNPKQFCVCFYESQRHCRLWWSFRGNNLPNMWMWSRLSTPKAAANHPLREQQP